MDNGRWHTPFLIAVGLTRAFLLLAVGLGTILAPGAAAAVTLLVDPYAGMAATALYLWFLFGLFCPALPKLARWATRAALRAVASAAAMLAWAAQGGTATVVVETEVYGRVERLEMPAAVGGGAVVAIRAALNAKD